VSAFEWEWGALVASLYFGARAAFLAGYYSPPGVSLFVWPWRLLDPRPRKPRP